MTIKKKLFVQKERKSRLWAFGRPWLGLAEAKDMTVRSKQPIKFDLCLASDRRRAVVAQDRPFDVGAGAITVHY